MRPVAQERVHVTIDGESGTTIRRRISETHGIRLSSHQTNSWNARFRELNGHFPRPVTCSTRFFPGVLIHLPEKSFMGL